MKIVIINGKLQRKGQYIKLQLNAFIKGDNLEK